MHAEAGRSTDRPQRMGASRARRTSIRALEEILDTNWTRAEQEGFRPDRLDVEEFVRAVGLHCDPRDATRSRIVKACRKIDRQDVIITPTLVADIVREEV